MSEMQSIGNGMTALLECVQGLSIDVDALKHESVNDSIVQWYSDRVSMLLDDNVPEAVNAYLTRLYKDDEVNSATQLFVLKAVMDLQAEYYEKRKKG